MSAPLIVAGCLALLGAGVHGIAGELLVVRRLSPARLAPSPFGGPEATLAMIHVTWHIATVAFVTVGCALLAAGTVLDGGEARAVALLAAGASTGFVALVLALGAPRAGSLRSALLHPAPTVLTATAALAWWGAL